MMTFSANMSTVALVALHNATFPETPMKSWKKSRVALIERLCTLGFAVTAASTSEEPTSGGAPTQFEAPEAELSAQVDRKQATDQKADNVPAPVAPKPRAKKAPKAKPAKAKPAKAKPAKAKKDKAPKKDKGEVGAIRRYVEELLLKTKGVDAKTKRPLGVPYSEILDKVKDRFPKAKTTLGCLRWYNTHLNNQHREDKSKPRLTMPLRPKSIAA